MVVKDGKSAMESTKGEVGEIDTSAPFQSVKHAVSMFGAVAFTRRKPATKTVESHPVQRVITKETQLHLVEKELMKLKDRLQNAEVAKVQALSKLAEAKKTVEDLQGELLISSKSKEAAIKETEDSRNQDGAPDAVVSEWQKILETFRQKYFAVSIDLNDAKRDLRKVRQDYDASLQINVSALEQASKAEAVRKENLEISSELSQKISVLKESIFQEKLASESAQQEREKMDAEKNVQRQAHKIKLDESVKQLQDLQKEVDPELISNIKLQLKNTVAEIEALQEEINSGKISDSDSLTDVTSELDNAKKTLQDVNDEDRSLRLLIESLKLEMGYVKNEILEMNKKVAEQESLAESFHEKLLLGKSELEACVAEESKVRRDCDELIQTLAKLSNESDSIMQEVQETNVETKVLKKEVEASKILNEEAKLILTGLLQEAEVAKASEAAALDQLKLLSKATHSARTSQSNSSAKLTLSKQEFGSLKRKVEESSTLAEMKVLAAMAQVEAVKASDKECVKKLHLAQKELDDLKKATEEALKRAAMSDAARAAIEGELRRLNKLEQKKVRQTASLSRLRSSLPSERSPEDHASHKSVPLEKMLGETWRTDNGGGTTMPKKALLPNLSGIFHRK